MTIKSLVLVGSLSSGFVFIEALSDSSSTINKDASILLLPLTLNVLNQSLSLLKALTFFLITKITGSFKEFKDNPKLEACLALKSEVLDVNDTASEYNGWC